MLMTRKNAVGGRELSKFGLEEEGGVWGYKIGYCKGCNEPILIRTIDVKDVVDRFGLSLEAYASMKYMFSKFRPKIPIRQRLARILVKEVDNSEH